MLRLLLVVLFLLVAGVAFEAWRSHRLKRVVVTEALREYAAFAAWRFMSGVEEKLYVSNVGRLAIGGGIRHGDPGRWLPQPDELRETRDRLERCACAFVAPTLFHFRVERPAHDDQPATVSIASTESASPALLRWLADTVLRDAAATPPDPMAFRTFFATPPGQPAVAVVYYAPRDGEHAPAVAVGFVAAQERFVSELTTAIVRDVDLLPVAVTGDVPTTDLLSVTLTDANGRPLTQPSVEHGGPYRAALELNAMFGSPTVEVVLNPARALSLIHGGAARTHIGLMLLGLTATAALIAIALGQLRREQQLVRLRADFTSSVSHELRTPLAQILLFGETLRSERARSDGERRLAMDVIVREARRLIHMVENVLHFARSERRLAHIQPEPLAVASIAEETVQGFAPLAQVAHARVALELTDDAVARVDRNALRQVVLNLLDNAVKYGPDGQTVTVGVSAAADQVRLWVEDEGSGVPADRREEIWRPFTRLTTHEPGARTGAGIGLAVVRELVEMHGGRAWVEDAPTGGARFVVAFPAIGSADAMPRSAEPRPYRVGVGRVRADAGTTKLPA